MKPRRHPLPPRRPPAEFRIPFPQRDADPLHAGRDPHEAIKCDWMGRWFPQPWHISVALFVYTLLLVLVTMSWTPFPGPPTANLLLHLKMEATPAVLHSLWGWGVRAAARLPGTWTVAAWMGLFSAGCGALAVTLLARLMMRVGYVIRNIPGPSSIQREAHARRISGAVAGLYLAGSIPFWVVSTRSLPGAFHLLLLLLAAWWFSQYQLQGRTRYLLGLGLTYGTGLTEHPTFWVFLPVAVFLTVREMFRWRTLRTWRAHLALGAGLVLGLSLYGVHALVLYRQGAAAGLYASPFDAWLVLVQEQMRLIIRTRHHAGFLVTMFLSLTPWLALFVLSGRSPWFYESWQVLLRLIFIAGLLAVLGNARFAPWALMGMSELLLMPYVLMAVALGYISGEFWVIGERHQLLDIRPRHRMWRHAASGLALLLPVAVLAVGMQNKNEADGRSGAFLYQAAEEILDTLDGPRVIFSSGVMDHTLRMAAYERQSPVLVVSAPRLASPSYLNQLARHFRGDALRFPLSQGDFSLFLDNFLFSESGLDQTVIMDVPEMFHEYGYPIPIGFVQRLQLDVPGSAELARLAAAQHPFWERMAAMAAAPLPRHHPAGFHQEQLLRMTSRMANNLGVLQAEQGDVDGAAESFRSAWRIHPPNASALLNLLGLALAGNRPDLDDIQRAWAERMQDLDSEKWGLVFFYGQVWNPRQWLPQGWGWALSGSPATRPGARLRPDEPDETSLSSRDREWLRKAYLLWDEPPVQEPQAYARLIRNPRNTDALLALSRLAIRRGDVEVAEVFMDLALQAGLPPEELLFDQAMVLVVQGRLQEAEELLERLTHLTPGDARVWAALLLMADPDDPDRRRLIRTLRSQFPGRPDVHLLLASTLIASGDWSGARSELERVIATDPSNAAAWEMLVTVARETDDSRLMEAGIRALSARDSHHYVGHQSQGVSLYQEGRYAEAEAQFRAGLRYSRNPVVLNNLAHVIRLQGGDLDEALELVNEALRRQPRTPSMLNTRAEIHIAAGRLEQAREDVLAALRGPHRNPDPLLHLIERYLDAGEAEPLPPLLRVAEALRHRMNPLQQRRLDDIQRRLP